MYTLRFVGYCGMGFNVLQDDDLSEIREHAARLIKSNRKRGFPVTTLSKGQEWEIMEPEDCFMVPDNCGVLYVNEDTEEFDLD